MFINKNEYNASQYFTGTWSHGDGKNGWPMLWTTELVEKNGCLHFCNPGSICVGIWFFWKEGCPSSFSYQKVSQWHLHISMRVDSYGNRQNQKQCHAVWTRKRKSEKTGNWKKNQRVWLVLIHKETADVDDVLSPSVVGDVVIKWGKALALFSMCLWHH